MKKILIGTAALAILAGGFWAVAFHGESPERLLAKGNRFFEQHKYADASLIYRKAIQGNPQYGEAYYRLGLTELELQDPTRAWAALFEASQLLPGNDDVQTRLGDLYLLNYQANHSKAAYNQVETIAGRLLAHNSNSFAGLRLKGYLAVADGRPGAAIEYFQRANQVQTLVPDVVMNLVQSLLLDGRETEAVTAANQLEAAHPEFGPIYDTVYAYYQQKGRTADAESVLVAKSARNPRNTLVVRQLAEHYWRNRQPALAEQTIQQLLINPGSFPQAYQTASNFYRQTGQNDAAIRTLEEGSKREPKERRIYQKLIVETLLREGNAREALQKLYQLIAEFPDDDELRGTRATLLVESSSEKDRELAVAELEGIVKRAPNNLRARYQLGRAYAGESRYEEARRSFEVVATRDANDFPSRLGLAELASKQADFRACLLWSEQALKLDPKSPNARLLHATALVGTGLKDAARTEYIRLIQDNPKYREAQLQLALLDVVQGRFEEAERGFRNNYDPGHGDFRALKGLIEVAVARKTPELAFELVQKELARNPQSQQLHSLRAELCSRLGRWEDAAQEYTELSTKQPDEAGYWMELGEARQHLGDPFRAAEAFSRARALRPMDWRPEFLLGYAHQSAGQPNEAIGDYRSCLRLNPTHPDALNNLAFLLAERGQDLNEALALASQASKISGSSPQVADTIGWIYLKQGRTDSAVQVFKELVSHNPQNAMVRYHLGLALDQRGQKQDARRELEAAVQAGLPKGEQSTATNLLSTY